MRGKLSLLQDSDTRSISLSEPGSCFRRGEAVRTTAAARWRASRCFWLGPTSGSEPTVLTDRAAGAQLTDTVGNQLLACPVFTTPACYIYWTENPSFWVCFHSLFWAHLCIPKRYIIGLLLCCFSNDQNRSFWHLADDYPRFPVSLMVAILQGQQGLLRWPKHTQKSYCFSCKHDNQITLYCLFSARHTIHLVLLLPLLCKTNFSPVTFQLACVVKLQPKAESLLQAP